MLCKGTMCCSFMLALNKLCMRKLAEDTVSYSAAGKLIWHSNKTDMGRVIDVMCNGYKVLFLHAGT